MKKTTLIVIGVTSNVIAIKLALPLFWQLFWDHWQIWHNVATQLS